MTKFLHSVPAFCYPMSACPIVPVLTRLEAGIPKNYCATNSGSPEVEQVNLRLSRLTWGWAGSPVVEQVHLTLSRFIWRWGGSSDVEQVHLRLSRFIWGWAGSSEVEQVHLRLSRFIWRWAEVLSMAQHCSNTDQVGPTWALLSVLTIKY